MLAHTSISLYKTSRLEVIITQNFWETLFFAFVVRPSQVKQLVEFQPNLLGVIGTIPSCAQNRHVPLPAQKGHQSYK
jgi:hypothetical protein